MFTDDGDTQSEEALISCVTPTAPADEVAELRTGQHASQGMFHV